MKITIIIPVYNAEKYLQNCINSILSQTFADFELLLINDGSQDSSGKICDEYARNKENIRVFHKENEGPSSARNFGLQQANGDYISFIDADDWIDSDYLENFIIELSNSSPNALIIQGAIYNYENNFSRKSDEYIYFASAWGNLFSREIIINNDIRFNHNMKFGEDTIFNFDYLKYVKDIRIVNKYGYHYRLILEGSSLTNKVPLDSIFSFYSMLEEKLKEPYIQNDLKLMSIVKQFRAQQFIRFIYKLNILKNEEKIAWLKLHNNLDISNIELINDILMINNQQIEISQKDLVNLRSSKSYRLGKFILRPFSYLKSAIKPKSK